MVYSAETCQIITDIFGDVDRIPVFDSSSYQLPDKFWQGIKVQIEDHENTVLQYTTFQRLEELAREMKFYDPFLAEINCHLKTEKISPENLVEIVRSVDVDLKQLNEHLCDFMKENGLALDIDFIQRRHKSRFSMAKRKIVRDTYVKYEEQQTSESFLQHGGELAYPDLMIDRIIYFVHSKEHLSYNKDVRDILKENGSAFTASIDTERAEYSRREYLAAGYSKEEVDMYCPVNLDTRFNLIENRSVLNNYKLSNKPKKARDGKGWSLLWQTGGCIYRFNYEPPQGRPVSLMVHANMQRLVWERILNDYPEYEEIYQAEFLTDSNFIPLGFEFLYLEYEKSVFANLQRNIHTTYKSMMGRLGFKDIDFEKVDTRISQMELCWNLPIPTDVSKFLILKYEQLGKLGLHSEIDSKTPLLATTFYSDVETGIKRFAHKEYRKSKKVFRNEIIFMGELKNEAFIVPARSYGNGHTLPPRTMSISDWLFRDLDNAKRYLFYKLHRRYRQVTGQETHGYYDWRNTSYVVSESRRRKILNSILLDSDLPDWLHDVDLFESLVDLPFIQRRFFKHFSEMEFRCRVRENPGLFQKIGHGRYRLKHAAVPEYRKVREALALQNELQTFIDSSDGEIQGGQ